MKPEAKPRDTFIYFIHEGKLRAPAAAMALIERLDAYSVAPPRRIAEGEFALLPRYPAILF